MARSDIHVMAKYVLEYKTYPNWTDHCLLDNKQTYQDVIDSLKQLIDVLMRAESEGFTTHLTGNIKVYCEKEVDI